MDDCTAKLIDELRRENKLLRTDIKRLNERIEHLERENRQLREELEKTQSR